MTHTYIYTEIDHKALHVDQVAQESRATTKMTARCSLIWVPWKFSRVPEYAHGYFSQNFQQAFVPIDPMNVRTKYEARSFTNSWDNRGIQKIWAVPMLPVLWIFNGLLLGWTLRMYQPNLKFMDLPVCEIIAIEFLDGGCKLLSRFPTYAVLIHQRRRQTDGQTTCNCNTTFCTMVHRMVKIMFQWRHFLLINRMDISVLIFTHQYFFL